MEKLSIKNCLNTALNPNVCKERRCKLARKK
jgi:hypothetical protein